jgi:Bacterial Ig domain/IPT/TIG domain/Family of unknown function (DUF6298)/Putative collagen-binding domain of a collagenase
MGTRGFFAPRFFFRIAISSSLFFFFLANHAHAVPGLVQRVGRDAGTTTAASLAFSGRNTPGNWIAVSLRAGSSGQVFSVRDSLGNTYVRAVQLNVTTDTPNGDTMAIFYAENIAGGANTVTVSDTILGTMRFAIFEYSGIAATNSLDAVAFAQGSGKSPSTGSVSTSSASDLIIGAIVTADSENFTAGAGYIIESYVPAQPRTKLIAQDRVQTTAGPVSANATLGASDPWGAVLAAFRATPGTPATLAPNITGINPTAGAVGTSVTITGSNFGGTQGSSTVQFNGVAATPSGWTAASIVAPVPAGAISGNVFVTVGGASSNGVNFSVTTAPSISSINPTSGVVGTSVTISGANFGATQGPSAVKFNGTASTPSGWSDASIVASVPAGATTGTVVVTVGSVASNAVSFIVTNPAPSITTLNPASGVVGTSVTISGANFGATRGSSTVQFNGVATTPSTWSANSVAAPVPSGATTGTVVVTVGSVASNGVGFTVTTSDTTPPAISITAPANGLTVSGTIIIGADASDNVGVLSVQFQVDGNNLGASSSTSPYSVSWDTNTAANGTHSITAIAKDAAGNSATSVAVSVIVSNSTGTGMGPLRQSPANSRYFINPAGNAVFLSGSHTWDDLLDTDTSPSPAPFDFTSYLNFLKTNNHNVTILWRKDLPQYCGWNFTGSIWNAAPWPWLRTGPGLATDGNLQFDLTQFNQTYFDRLRSEVQQLQQNNIYAIIELFDGNQLTSARCSTDGYPFTAANNVNGVDDGYTGGSCGVGSVTMTANNAITSFQDAYVEKAIDALNDLPNVLWEIAEEQPGSAFASCPGYGGASSMSFWAAHMFGLIKAYEAGGVFEGTSYTAKAFQHPVGIGAMNYNDRVGGDATLYASTATWITPAITAGMDIFPSNVPLNNQGKVVLNNSDHALGWHAFLNADGSVQDQNLRGYLWENLTSGAEGVIFMDPYEVFWQSAPMRNNCLNAVHHICNGVDAKYNPFRSAMGILQNFANSNLNLLRMTPQNSLASTGFCLADNSPAGSEYVVYAPTGGSFTVNLSATTRVLNITWLNPATGATSSGTSVTGGSTLSFTPPFSGDAVLYLVDAGGHN